MNPGHINQRTVKIALYCHNRDGLGHIVRSIHIATSLMQTGLFEPVLLTGCRALDAIYIPPGLRVHQLTPVPADPFASNMYAVLSERVTQIKDFMRSFSPDIVLVDSVPLGYMKELKSVLDAEIQQQGGTLFVLGLPYVPNDLNHILQTPGDRGALSVYRCGLVYTDENEPGYEALPFPLMPTGLVGGPPPPASNDASNVILVLAGGGTVSLSLLEPLIKSTAVFRKQGFVVRFVTGPLADHAQMLSVAAGHENFELVAVSSSEEALQDAKIVIARCGYNTAATLVRTKLPILFIPYCTADNPEQLTRAEKLAALKNIITINPLSEKLDTALEPAIRTLLDCEPAERTVGKFSGGDEAARRLSEIALQLLQTT